LTAPYESPGYLCVLTFGTFSSRTGRHRPLFGRCAAGDGAGEWLAVRTSPTPSAAGKDVGTPCSSGPQSSVAYAGAVRQVADNSRQRDRGAGVCHPERAQCRHLS